MKTVYLHGGLGKRFGSKWELAVETPADVIKAIDANSEGFCDYIQLRGIQGEFFSFLKKHPKRIKSQDELEGNLIPSNLVDIKYEETEVHIISNAYGGVVTTFFGGALLGKIASAVVWSAVTQLAMSVLFKPPKPPARGTPTTTKSYLMNGASTRQAQGIAVPLGYGRLRVGGANISNNLENIRLSRSTNAQSLESYSIVENIDLVCEGPIEGFVNKYGGAISGGDIREGIYLNDVQVKNTPSSSSENGTFNYILNELGDSTEGAPQFTSGSSQEKKPLSSKVFSKITLDTTLYGPGPYANPVPIVKTDPWDFSPPGTTFAGAASTPELAVEGGAKIVSHSVLNTDVDSVSFSFETQLQISNDNGSTSPNHVDFAILMVRSDGEYNVLGSDSECLVFQGKSDQVSENPSEKNKKIREEAVREIRANMNPRGLLSGLWLQVLSDDQLLDMFGVGVPPEDGDVSGLTYVDNGLAKIFRISGIATSAYSFDIKVVYQPKEGTSEMSSGVTFKVIKLSSEYDPSVKDGPTGGLHKMRSLKISTVVESISESLLYPNSAMIKTIIDSKNFSQSPNRTYHLKLKKVLIPSNYDPESRKYNGPWTGLFKGQSDPAQSVNEISEANKFWTDNPAWIFFDLLYNPRYGIGKYGLEESRIDKWQLYKIGKYCDELVETDFPVETATSKPRSFSYVAGTAVTNSKNFTITVDDPDLSTEDFTKEFGSGGSFLGKKLAMFLYQHNFGQDNVLSVSQQDSIRVKSINRDGEINIQERTILQSNPDLKTLTLVGSDLDGDPAFFNGGSQAARKVIGSCSTQINHAVVEPRFTANLFLTERSEALEIINSLASIFRGMVGYSGGKVSSTFDRKQNPVQLFNNSNVMSEGFRYIGVHKNKKITASLVRFNNKGKNFKPDVVYEEDSNSMQSLGYVEDETMGFGITSEGQARRLARWVLLTSQLETETVRFKTGQEGAYLLPGSIFEVSDESRTSSDKSGRVLDVQINREKVLLDRDGELFVSQTAEYFDPYILIDKSNLSSPGSNVVELSVYCARSNESLGDIEKRSSFESSEEDQMQEINSLTSPQLIRFEGFMGTDPSINKLGPQGQKSIVQDLKLKVDFEISTSDNLIKSYDHGLGDGDTLTFSSDGTLPSGLRNDLSYYVVNSTKHTFQVSEVFGGGVVNIFSLGRDMFGNAGGHHYFIISDRGMIVASLNQIGIGSVYSIKGLIGSRNESSVMTEGDNEFIGVLRELTFPNWYFSNIFGYIYYNPSASSDWIYESFLGWVYVGEMRGRVIGDGDGFWMYIGGTEDSIKASGTVGWVYTQELLKNTFWYIYDLNKWVYLLYQDESLQNIAGFFVYDSLTVLNRGDRYKLGSNREMFISMVVDGLGYYLLDRVSTNLGVYTVPLNTPPPVFGQGNNPLYREFEIDFIYSVGFEDSLQGESCVRIDLIEGHGLDLNGYYSLSIYGVTSNINDFDQSINAEWRFTRVDVNTIELNRSSELADTLGNIISNGKISLTLNNSSVTDRFLQGQLFRTISVKEVASNEYEVVGLEYNSSKFFAADQKGVVRTPALPIPPQADMSIPEAPDGLLLFDLTL